MTAAATPRMLQTWKPKLRTELVRFKDLRTGSRSQQRGREIIQRMETVFIRVITRVITFKI